MVARRWLFASRLCVPVERLESTVRRKGRDGDRDRLSTTDHRLFPRAVAAVSRRPYNN
jgi:hypothetical protein